MRIDGWSITGFGPLARWDVSDLAKCNVVVLLGPNESGKSALFEFFASSLFGFSPAKADDHPYRPWDGKHLGGRLDAILGDGRRVSISRRLMSRPQGQIEADGLPEILDNRPAPWVELMNRDIFKNVYALTQTEALRLDQQAWQQMQDRLLGGSSFDFLRPSREVLKELEDEASGLWRQDRRGKPKFRAIEAEIRSLRREALPRALAQRPQIESADRRLAEIELEMSRNSLELQSVVLALDRNGTLGPLVRRVERMEQLTARADSLVPRGLLREELPQQRARLVAGLERLQTKQEQLKHEAEKHQRALELDDETRLILNSRSMIERVNAEVSLVLEDQRRIGRMDARLQREAGALREFASRALETDRVDQELHDALLNTSVAESRGRLRVWQEAKQALDDASRDLRATSAERVRLEQDLAATESTISLAELDERLGQLRKAQLDRVQSKSTSATWVVLVGGGLASIFVLLLAGNLVGWPVGVFLFLACIAVLLAIALATSRRTRLRSRDIEAGLRELGLEIDADIASEIDRVQDERDRAILRASATERLSQLREVETVARAAAASERSDAETAHARFLEALSAVPIAPVHREAPDDGLLRDIEDMRKLVESARGIRKDRDDLAARLETWRCNVDELKKDLDGDFPDDDLEAAAVARRALEKALSAEQAAVVAEAELSALRQDLEECNRELDEIRLEFEKIDDVLKTADPRQSDPYVGLERLQRALELRDEARRARIEIERESPDWRTCLENARELVAAGEKVELDDEERVGHELRVEELRTARENSSKERGRLEAELERLMSEPGPAHIEGEIEYARDRLRDIKKERDRLTLLRQIVRMADRSYRELYQPPLLEAASRYLHQFTNGRYDFLDVDEAAPRDRRRQADVPLQVHRSGDDFPKNVDTPLSRGTIQQIYFALRLAMVDLVEGDEPLPLFLDEMFVNWDPSRTTSGLAALADMPGNRQVFLFTADPFWAERAVRDVPAHIVRTPAA